MAKDTTNKYKKRKISKFEAFVSSSLIVTFLLIQAYIPLEYYILKEDKLDERFSWRMFSEINIATTLNVSDSLIFAKRLYNSEKLHHIDHTKCFNTAWLAVLSKGHRNVVKKATLYMCKSGCTGNSQREISSIKARFKISLFNESVKHEYVISTKCNKGYQNY